MLSIDTLDGRWLGLPVDYLRRGFVDYSYALTITKSQGKTVSEGFTSDKVDDNCSRCQELVRRA